MRKMRSKGNFATDELVLLGLAVIAAGALIVGFQQGVDHIVTSILEKLL